MPPPPATAAAPLAALSARFFYSSIAERLFTNVWYSLVAKLDKHADEPFMNYGFAELDGAQIPLAPKLEPHRYAIQLYHHVVANGAVAGKDVLEIGCGRGGGASYVAAALEPHRYVGLDINKTAIACDRRFYHDQPNLEFVAGDAHALPFGDGMFGVALNVESSHHYRDIGTFFGEVHRVLEPGGTFLMACFPRRSELASLREPLDRSAFTCVLEEDITANVVRALEIDSARREASVNRLVPAPLRTFAREFAGVRGSELYESFASGKRRYLNLVLRKSG
jgi:SAM-dependent methyltransferase